MELFNPYFYAANIDLLAYENAWIQYMESGEKNENVINRDIYDSWDKSSSFGVDPFSLEKPDAVDEQELERRLRKNRYVFQIVEPSMEILFDIINESEYAVILSDREGVIIRVMCGQEMKDICSKINLHEGADYRLESVGTSSINMAIELKKPVQITGCQHYRQIFQHYTSSSAPVLTESGGVLCVLSVLGKYEQENEHTLGMIHSITKGIESQHHINKINRNLKKRNNQLEKILSMVSDSIVYTENRKIIQVNGSMLKLIGKDESEVIGRNVYDAIVTQPSLAEFFADEKKANTGGHVLLIGKNDSYKCIISTEEVSSGFEKSPGGRLIRFTQIKMIEMMASKMQFAAKYTFEDLIGESDSFSEAITVAKKASAFDSRVIITGESGTGKEMFAQAIHNNSSRKAGPFVAVDCGAIPHELFESEFFGYEKGAFTGARREGKEGLVEKASNGTLFLDEIGNMSLDMQIKLLRVLQEGVVFRIGGASPVNVDLRVIAATNADLEQEIRNGTFREDLYYRLNVFRIKIPPLRERRSDIPLLVNNIIKTSNNIDPSVKVDKSAMDVFTGYDWPGNVRQLHNAVERAIIMADEHVIYPESISGEISGSMGVRGRFSGGGFEASKETLEEMTGRYIKFCLDMNDGNISRTARQLDVSRTTIYKYISW